MKQLMKRFLTLLLCAVMLLGMFPAVTAHAADAGKTIYFDNSEVQWDQVYVMFQDNSWNHMGEYTQMKEGKNDIWSIEAPAGAHYVHIGPAEFEAVISDYYEAGKTYTASFYAYSKVYTYVSDQYIAQHFPGMDGCRVSFLSADGYQNIEMKPVTGKDGVWYASVGDNVYRESIRIECHYSQGLTSWEMGADPGCNMFCVTTLSDYYWTKYDKNTTYEDKLLVSGVCGENAKWKYDKDTGTLTISGSGAMFDYKSGLTPWQYLSGEIQTITVKKGITAIGSNAFQFMQGVTKVSLGSTIKTIGENAFHFCTSLTSIKLPAALKNLAESAFAQVPLETITVSSSNKYFCVDDGVLFNKDKTVLYKTTPGHVSYTVPKTVDKICGFACNDFLMRKLTIPEGVKEIGECAFMGTNLTTVHLPASLKKLGLNAFGGSLISSYTVASGNKYFSAKDGVLFNKDKTRLIAYPGAASRTSYTVPSTVKELAPQALWYSNNLTKVKLPKGLKEIPVLAFGYCEKLKTINIPETVTAIGDSAFAGCKALTSIYIPGSVKEWGYNAFGSTGLEEVTFGYGIQSMGMRTFADCTNLKKVHVPASVSDLANIYDPYSYNNPFFYCSSKLTIVAHKGSEAETFAERMGLKFKAADHKEEDDRCMYCGKYMRLDKPSIKLSGVSSTGKIKVKWSKIDGADKYQVYRATSKDGKYTKLTTTSKTSYTDDSAKAGTKYYYKVRAVTEDGVKSSYSSIQYRYCDLPRPVVEESNVTSSGKIKLEWQKISGAKEYEIYRATSKSGTYKKLATTDDTDYTDKTVKAGKVYYYKVKAIHKKSNANSAYSSVVGQTCKLARPNVKIKLSSDYPKLTWAEVEGAKEYKVYRATEKDGKYTAIKTTTSLKYTDKTAEAGMTYYYKVKAIHTNSTANSAYSSIDSIEVPVGECSEHSCTSVVTEPTCETGGYTTYTCTVCGYSYQSDLTEALGHGWGNWYQVEDSATGEVLYEGRTCQRDGCGATENREYEDIAATCEHEWRMREGGGYYCPLCTTAVEELPEGEHCHEYEWVCDSSWEFDTGTCKDCGEQQIIDGSTSEFCQDVITIINQYREAEGLSPVEWFTWKAMLIRARELTVYFSHSRPDGSDGHDTCIAAGYDSAQAVVDGWMGSINHRGSLMNPNATEASAAYNGSYWVLYIG